MTSYRDIEVDTDAILDDIRRVAAIESPTSHPVGVNAVLDVIEGWFEGTGATFERIRDPRWLRRPPEGADRRCQTLWV